MILLFLLFLFYYNSSDLLVFAYIYVQFHIEKMRKMRVNIGKNSGRVYLILNPFVKISIIFPCFDSKFGFLFSLSFCYLNSQSSYRYGRLNCSTSSVTSKNKSYNNITNWCFGLLVDHGGWDTRHSILWRSFPQKYSDFLFSLLFFLYLLREDAIFDHCDQRRSRILMTSDRSKWNDRRNFVLFLLVCDISIS